MTISAFIEALRLREFFIYLIYLHIQAICYDTEGRALLVHMKLFPPYL